MNKTKLLLPILIGMILFCTYSCKNDNGIEDYQVNHNLVSSTEARIIAENILDFPVFKPENSSSLKSAKISDQKMIKDSITISDKNDKKSKFFYVFNYEGGGFSIISADKSISPILAYSETGYFDLNELPSGFAYWLDLSAFNIKENRKQNANPSTVLAQEWNQLLQPSGELISSNLALKSAPIDPPPGTTVYTVGPLLQTSWGQGCGYNTFCPVKNGSDPSNCQHAPTGCVPTAMAQVMAYWKYPSNYNWNAMPLSSGNDEIAHLMADIGDAVGTVYDVNQSGTDPAHIVGGFKNSTFHYSSATHSTSYNYNTVKNNLDMYNKWPVILGGNSTVPNHSGYHCWVCDGYKSYVLETGISYLYFHMNWGKDGNYNDVWYYSNNNWPLPNGENFCNNVEMIYNIHP